MNAHKRWGNGAKFLCPISLVHSNLSAVLFVDDTNVMHLDINRKESHLEALEELQQSVMSWGKFLIATGGSLKPSKCFYHLVSFLWKQDGTWEYDKNEDNKKL